MSELSNSRFIGMGDLQLATRREVRRLVKEARGNRHRAVVLCLKRFVELELISEAELKSLTRMYEIGLRSGRGRVDGRAAYLQCRALADEMVANAKTSPPALALALAETNSYLSIDESGDAPTVVYKTSSKSWTGTLRAAGGALGGLLGGAAGAGLGIALGQLLGEIVDECTKDDDPPT